MRTNKIYKLITIVIIMTNLASCQNKGQSKEINPQGFCIQDASIYYNGQQFEVVGMVDNFVKIAGQPDRIVVDSLGGNTNKSWDWHKSGYEAYETEKKTIQVFNSKTNDSKIEKEYKNINEVIKVLGKFDEYKEDKQPLDVRTYYIWDKLGIEIYITPKKEINGITLNTLHPNKLKEVTQKELEDPGLIYDNTPKGEYKGLFTYNGHTIDFRKMDYDNWFKTVEGLKIRGEKFDPPGDSKDWSRMIYENHLTVEIIRDSNELNTMSTNGYSVKDIGIVNTVKYIQISN